MKPLLAIALLLSVAPSDECLKCHTAAATQAHPFAVEYNMARRFASMKLKPNPPRELLIDGRVECASCHVTHAEESTQPSRLRGENVTKLCVACHVLD